MMTSPDRIQVMATLWPDMPHFKYFSKHRKLDGLRLNTAMVEMKGLGPLLKNAVDNTEVPLYFDVKGRQLRITKVYPCDGDHLELDLNHPIEVNTPAYVLFKGGVDACVLKSVEGNHLVFDGGPKFNLVPGESLTIRSDSLKVLGPTFTEQQLELLSLAKEAGILRYMLSYASSDEELAELASLVGNYEELIAKVENKAGLRWALTESPNSEDILIRAKSFDSNRPVKSRKIPPNVHYLTARGDLFIELPMPHDILWASKQLVQADPQAILGSRMLLSLSKDSIPSCSDVNEIAWLLSIGYKRFMFCDSLCLDREALDRAINVMRAIVDKPYLGASDELL